MGILAGITPVKPTTPCKIGQLLIELDEEDSKILDEALADERWTARSLARALNDRGIPLATDTVRSHKNKTCRCSRT
jgi:hypothetical protein